MDVQIKALIFDIVAECRVLKAELQQAGIGILIPFLGIHSTEALRKETERCGYSPGDCLLLTNKEQHAKEAKLLGMPVIGCVEGHFEVPKTTVLLESPEEVSVSYLNRVFCHERGIPAVILETPRLFVRELRETETAALYEILTDVEVARFLPAKTGTREEELEKLSSYVSCVYSFFEFGYWGVFLKETGELIGRAGFREGSYPPEVGYVLKRSKWGLGLGTELLSGLLLYAKEEIDCTEVVARMDNKNAASMRVAEKCGFLRVPCEPVSAEICHDMPEKESNTVLYHYVM